MNESIKKEETYQKQNSEQKTRKNNKRRKLTRLIAAIALLIGVGIGIRFYLYSLSHESSDDAVIEGHIIVISPRVSNHIDKVLVKENQRVQAGELLVELDPEDFQVQVDAARANLEAAKAKYRSTHIQVDLTSISTTSDVNEAEASVKLAEATVEKASAAVDAAKSRIEFAKAQLHYARSTLAQVIADADAAKMRHQLDEADLARYKKTEASISKQDFDHEVAAERLSAAALNAAKKKVEAERSMVAQAEASLKTSEEGLHQSNAQLLAAQAQLEQAKAHYSAAIAAPKRVEQSRSQAQVSMADIKKADAAFKQAELNLSYTKIYAPSDGYVTKKYVEPGMYVQVGQSLMSIVRPDVWVTANFKETQLTHILPGQPATIIIDAYPAKKFKGYVESIQHGTGARFSMLPPENATGNYVKVVQRVPVKIVFNNLPNSENYLLAPGMSVVPEIDIKAKVKALPFKPLYSSEKKGVDEISGANGGEESIK